MMHFKNLKKKHTPDGAPAVVPPAKGVSRNMEHRGTTCQILLRPCEAAGGMCCHGLSLKWRGSCGIVLPATSAHLKKGWVPGLAAARTCVCPRQGPSGADVLMSDAQKKFAFCGLDAKIVDLLWSTVVRSNKILLHNFC